MSGRRPDHVLRRAVLAQRWTDLTFLHWRLPSATLQPLLPSGLSVQVVDGSGWVALVPFRMRDVRVPGLGGVPGWTDFAELNARTYVRARDGTDGVWFFHLYCASPSFVAAVRPIGPPYRYAHAWVRRDGGGLHYRFARNADLPPCRCVDRARRGGAGPATARPLFDAWIEPGAAVPGPAHTPLLDSLTGRWNAYVVRFGRLLRVPVVHEPWPLRTGTVRGGDWRWRALGLPTPEGDPLVHVSAGVHARFGPPVVVPG